MNLIRVDVFEVFVFAHLKTRMFGRHVVRKEREEEVV